MMSALAYLFNFAFSAADKSFIPEVDVVGSLSTAGPWLNGSSGKALTSWTTAFLL